MDDNKTQLQNPDGGKQPDPTQEYLRQLTRRVNDLHDLLRSQRDVLKKRGMTLPTNALDKLRVMKGKVDKLSKSIVGSQIELRQLRALVETAALISSSQETEKVLNEVMDTVIQLVGAERGYIVLKNKETGELDFRISRGMDQEQLDTKKELVVSKSIVTSVAETGEPVLTDNASQDERYAGQQSIVGFQLRSILAVPLNVRGELIGVVYCDNRIIAGLFKKHELDILTAFANQAAVAIENARLFETSRARLAQVTEMRDFMDNIFTSIASGVITVDRDNTIIVCNASAQRTLKVADPIGRSLSEVLGDVTDVVMPALEKVRSEAIQQRLNIEPEVAGVGQRYWQFIISPMRGSGGGGVAIVLDDLTEQKAAEAQLTAVRRYLPGALVENIRHMDSVEEKVDERQITVLSSDVRGFTTFSERLEPEQLMEVINKYLSLASDAINLYEGIVDKYMGDAVTGLFNTHLNPQADHAQRAVQAALNLIFDLHAQHEVMPEEERLFYGIGIHSDIAVLGNVGNDDRKEFAALGDAINISKYLEGNAGPGEVVISESTYELVKEGFECEPVEELRRPKPGYEAVWPIYRVLKRKRGARTGPLMVDPELMALLEDLKDE